MKRFGMRLVAVLFLFIGLVIGWGGRAAGLTAYTATGDKPGGVYKVKVNGTDIPAIGFHGVHYSWLGYRGKARISVEVAAKIEKHSVWPSRHGIETKAEGNVLKFAADCSASRYLIVRINSLEHLCLLIDPPERLIARPIGPGVVNVARFMRGGAGADQTGAFKKAIAAANGTRKTVFVPRGVYTTGTINLVGCRNMQIYLQPGCVLRSPVDHAANTCGFLIAKASNIMIFGRGTMDHTAWENIARDKQDHKKINGCPVVIMSSQNITIEGLTVRNSRSWNYKLKESDNVILRNCKVISPPQCNPEWTDGFNPTSCRKLLIEDCFCYVNDDCFATGHNTPKENTRGSENCVVRRLVGFNSRANGVRMGWDCIYNEGTFKFLQCDFLLPKADHGVVIHQLKKKSTYSHILFDGCSFSEVAKLTYQPVCIGAGSCVNSIHGRAPGSRIGHLEFKDCSFDSLKPSIIAGTPGNGIGRLTITNLTVAGKRCTTLKDASIRVENAGKVNVK